MKQLTTALVMCMIVCFSQVSAMSIVQAVQIGGSNDVYKPTTTTVTVQMAKPVVNEGQAVVFSQGSTSHFNRHTTTQTANNTQTSTLIVVNSGHHSGSMTVYPSSGIVLTKYNSGYVASHSSTNHILFQTKPQLEYVQSMVDSGSQVIVFNNPQANNNEIYVIQSGKVYYYYNVVAYNYVQPTNYSKKVLIIKIVANNMYMYSVTDLNNAHNYSFTSSVSMNYDLEQYLLYNSSFNNISLSVSSVTTDNTQYFPPNYFPKPSFSATPQQNFVIGQSRNSYGTPATLTYKITYSLGARDSQGSYKLESPKCSSNGSVDQFYIKKRPGDVGYGIGTELNEYPRKSHRVKLGDQLCCTVIQYSPTYKQAGGCMIIK